jgi:hypothetical protein
MNRALMLIPIVFILAVPTSVGADQGDHWCEIPDGLHVWPTSLPGIPVYIHPDMPGELLHADNSPWGVTELQREVQIWIERFNEQSSSGLPPLFFAGFEAPVAWDSEPADPYSITIRPNRATGAGSHTKPRFCSEQMTGAPGSAEGSGGPIIWIPAQIPGCSFKFEHWSISEGADGLTLGGTLFHEGFHAVGFDHTGVCNPAPVGDPLCANPTDMCCGLMISNGCSNHWSNSKLDYSDVDGLRTVYGPPDDNGVGGPEYQARLQSSDGLSWTNLGPGLPYSTAFMGGGYSNDSTWAPVTLVDEELDAHLWAWYRPAGVFFDFGKAYSAPQYGKVDATTASGKWHSFYMWGQSAWFTAMYPAWTQHSGTDQHVFSLGYLTDLNGHTAVHDPRYNKLIHAWRAPDKTIVMGVSELAGDFLSNSVVALDDNQPGGCRASTFGCASTTPEIACSPTSSFDGTRNCVMAWASQPTGSLGVGQTYPHDYVLKYVQFRTTFSFAGGFHYDFNFGPVGTVGYVAYGAPSIVYKGPKREDPDAFILAWKNPGRCFYTLRKSVSETTAFNSIKGHCGSASAHFNSPMTASDNSGIGQVWNTANYAP